MRFEVERLINWIMKACVVCALCRGAVGWCWSDCWGDVASCRSVDCSFYFEQFNTIGSHLLLTSSHLLKQDPTSFPSDSSILSVFLLLLSNTSTLHRSVDTTADHGHLPEESRLRLHPRAWVRWSGDSLHMEWRVRWIRKCQDFSRGNCRLDPPSFCMLCSQMVWIQ